MRTVNETDLALSRRTGGMLAGIVCTMLFFGMLLSSCIDQPIDDGGTARFDTTIVRVHDTIVISETDTIIETRIDTIVKDRFDTIRVVEVRRDTLRDTITRFEVDTIEVPIRSDLFRSAKLVYPARYDSGGFRGEVETLQIDVSDWIQYTVVDSGGIVLGLGLSLSVAIPPRFHYYALGVNPNAVPFRLHGVTLFIPTTRMGLNRVNPDSLLLRDHPFSANATADGRGGLALTVQRAESNDLESFWTGQVTEINTQPGTGRVVSSGVIRIEKVNSATRVITLAVETRIFLRALVSNVMTVQQVPVNLNLQLGY